MNDYVTMASANDIIFFENYWQSNIAVSIFEEEYLKEI